MADVPYRTFAAQRSHWAAAGISILNGVFGDYLQQRQNGLALRMAFMHRARALPMTRTQLQQAHPAATAKLCVLVHGLCCNESSWSGKAPDGSVMTYGSCLQADLGYTPFYLRYNSGLPIAQNGAALAALLAELLVAYPLAVEEIVLIGHSMGGLVLRSACEAAGRQRLSWVQRVTRVFYLGTPHEGAPLERLTHTAVAALRTIPNPITALVGETLDLRSRGIKDLRRGDVLAPSAASGPTPIAWLASAQHYLIAGSLTENPQHIASLLLGDALVRLPRKKGARAGSAAAVLPQQNIKVFGRMHHMQLAHDMAVYEQIRNWCAAG